MECIGTSCRVFHFKCSEELQFAYFPKGNADSSSLRLPTAGRLLGMTIKLCFGNSVRPGGFHSVAGDFLAVTMRVGGQVQKLGHEILTLLIPDFRNSSA